MLYNLPVRYDKLDTLNAYQVQPLANQPIENVIEETLLHPPCNSC